MSVVSLSMLLKPKRIQGQGMTEYIIIVALIAVAAIGVFRFYGNTARSQVAVAASELGGQNSATSRASATQNANNARREGETAKNLASFQEGSR